MRVWDFRGRAIMSECGRIDASINQISAMNYEINFKIMYPLIYCKFDHAEIKVGSLRKNYSYE